MSDPLPEAREQRWRGLVCAGCRLIFRVARDYQGGVVVCPSCQTRMRMPVSARHLQTWRPEVVPAAGMELRPRMSRSSRPGWERDEETAGGEPARAAARHPRQVALALFLGLLLVGGLLFVTLGGERGAEADRAGRSVPGAAGAQPGSEAAALDFEAMAVPVVERLLAAREVDDFAALVRHPEVTLPRIRGLEAAPQPGSLRQLKFIKSNGAFYHAVVELGDGSKRRICLEKTAAGMRVDWEGWVGWSPVRARDFRQSKATRPELFRGTLTPVSYYNYEFQDETRWSAWMVRLPGSEEFFYGYVARDSLTEQQLLAARREAADQVTLMLAYPAGAQGDKLCEITAVVAAGWSEDPAMATTPPTP